MTALETLLKQDYADLKESVQSAMVEARLFAEETFEEAKKKPYVVSWTKIQRQRKRGGLSTRLLRAQMLKQRRRYRGRTGRRGHFLRMRPKLLRNLKKAMRAGARIKAVRHRRWTMRRAGHLIKRMKGGVEKFTGRARYRRKKVKRTGGRKVSISAYRGRGKKQMAAGYFYGISPLLAEAFISDSVNGRIERDDLIVFLAIEAEAIEHPLFPIAVTMAAFIEESQVADNFFDIDILDNSLYVYFEKLKDNDFDDVSKVLSEISEHDLYVKEGERLDNTNISDFTVYRVVPTAKFTQKIIEDVIGTEEEFINECKRDADKDDYTAMLIIEKSVEEGMYDIEEGSTSQDDDIEEGSEYNPDDPEDVPDEFFEEALLDIAPSLLDDAGFETDDVDEKFWVASVRTKWSPPKGLFAKGSASKIASVLKGSSESLKQAMSRLNFFINRASADKTRRDVLVKVKGILRKQYGKGKKK